MDNFVCKIPITKLAGEQQLVTGWASVVEDANGNPIVDLQGDLIPIEELERAAHEALLDGGKDKGGDMHESMRVADIVESFVVTREKRAALGFGEGPAGWVVTLKIKDKDLWSQIKSGEKLELSIAGEAEREPI